MTETPPAPAVLGHFTTADWYLLGGETRGYTKGDTPLHTAVLVSPEEWVATLGS